MTDLTIRRYLHISKAIAGQGVRSCCAPAMRGEKISLRTLMTSLRVIHLSDLHFTNSEHTWDVGGPLGIRKVTPDRDGRQLIADFLVKNRDLFGTDIIVITGDITDSGTEEDYRVAEAFIRSLETPDEHGRSFQVHVVPGNHDYCWWGNFFFEDLFRAIQAIDTTAAVLALAGAIAPATPLLGIPDGGATFAAAVAGAVAAAEGSVMLMIKATIRTQLTIFLGLSSALIPEEFVDGLALMFTVLANTAIVGIKIEMKDTVDNEVRRGRFIRYITKPRPGDSINYPRFFDLGNGSLILLDSLQDKMNHPDSDPSARLAQGRLGQVQLSDLSRMVADCQAEGKKLIVCLHHSPFYVKRENQSDDPHLHANNISGLDDSKEFLSILRKQKIDCLLYGHWTPTDDVFQQPSATDDEPEKNNFRFYEDTYAAIVNCENLEKASTENGGFRISVIDLGSYLRIVYRLDGIVAERSWGNPSSL